MISNVQLYSPLIFILAEKERGLGRERREITWPLNSELCDIMTLDTLILQISRAELGTAVMVIRLMTVQGRRENREPPSHLSPSYTSPVWVEANINTSSPCSDLIKTHGDWDWILVFSQIHPRLEYDLRLIEFRLLTRSKQIKQK